VTCLGHHLPPPPPSSRGRGHRKEEEEEGGKRKGEKQRGDKTRAVLIDRGVEGLNKKGAGINDNTRHQSFTFR
jgi:hypothetical protein